MSQAFLFYPNDASQRPERASFETFSSRPKKRALTCCSAAVKRLKPSAISTCVGQPSLTLPAEMSVHLSATKDGVLPDYVRSFIGQEDHEEASPIRLRWYSWSVAVARALQALGFGFTTAVEADYETMNHLISKIQTTVGLAPLICGGKPPLLAKAIHPEPTEQINWRSISGGWLDSTADGDDLTNAAVRMECAAKILQNTIPPEHSKPPDRVHVIGDSTLRVGHSNLVLDEAFKSAALADGGDYAVGAYRLHINGDLYHLAAIALGILNAELARERGVTPASGWDTTDCSDFLTSGGATLCDDGVLLKDVPDGSVNASILIFWSGNDFCRDKTRWDTAAIEQHNVHYPQHQLVVRGEMVDRWSPYFAAKIAKFSAILRKFKAPLVIGPGRASDWGFPKKYAFDKLARQATAAFETQSIPIISPHQYGLMERISPNNVHFSSSKGNVAMMMRVFCASTRAATLCSILRDRTLNGVQFSRNDQLRWANPPP